MISLVLMTLRDMVWQHILWLVPILLVVFAILMPQAACAVFGFLTRTLPGQIITACLVSAIAAWTLRGYVDETANRRREIVAARDATARAEAERRAAEAREAELRRQIVAADTLAEAARQRADALDAAAQNYQEKEQAYEARLAAQPVATACALDDADVRGLRDAAGAFGARSAGASRRP